MSDTVRRGHEMPSAEQANLNRFELVYERAVFDSMSRFFSVHESAAIRQQSALAAMSQLLPANPLETKATADAAVVYQRKPEVKGPMTVFGYDYFEDRYGKERSKEIRLLKYEGLWGGGGEYAYEVLNFANGKLSVQGIRDKVAAIYGPVPLDDVIQYLKALESIGVVQRVK